MERLWIGETLIIDTLEILFAILLAGLINKLVFPIFKKPEKYLDYERWVIIFVVNYCS